MTPTQKTRVRAAISDYCQRAEKARLKWNYDMVRRFGGFMVAPELHHANDCSGYCSLAFNWAMHHTGLYLADPLGEHYTGWGNTNTALDFLQSHQAPADKYLVGDMAIFTIPGRRTEHMSICRKPGTTRTAIFSSNGRGSWIFNQDAPEPVSLAVEEAQQRLVGVYRHPSLL